MYLSEVAPNTAPTNGPVATSAPLKNPPDVKPASKPEPKKDPKSSAQAPKTKLDSNGQECTIVPEDEPERPAPEVPVLPMTHQQREHEKKVYTVLSGDTNASQTKSVAEDDNDDSLFSRIFHPSH